MRHLRVMLLATDLQRGGLPLRLVRLARRFHEINIEPIVGCLAPAGPLSDVLRDAGIETFACDAAGRFDPRCLAALAACVRRYSPDLIHASLFHANVAARLVGRLDRPRPIITSTVTIEIERRWHRTVESLTAGLSDLHVANSHAVARHLLDELGFDADRLIVIRNAVDFDELDRTPPRDRSSLELDDDASLIVWAGRMDPVKNLPTLIDVVERLSRKRRVQAVLIGDGPDRRRVEAMVERRSLSRIVRVMGWSGEVACWMKAADALCFPSLTEGSPNVLLEALAVGCPVVTSDAPACVEMASEAGCGATCHPYDTEGMVRALCAVLDQNEHAKASARAGSARLRALHDMPAILGVWRAAYDHAMG